MPEARTAGPSVGTRPSVGTPRAASHLSGWRALARERMAIPVLLTIAAAQATSAQYVVRSSLDLAGLAIAALGTTALMALLRLMDEVKDLDKDRVAHPERPLPRGALTPAEAKRGVAWGAGVLFVVAVWIAVGRNPMAGVLYGGCVAFSLLMYREFFVPRFLGDRPLLYALTHQGIVLPIYAFATAVTIPTAALSAPVLWFTATGLGASFALEVSRKLDPAAHPVLQTYLHVYGPHRTVLVIATAIAVVAAAAPLIGVHFVLWPVVALMFATLPVVIVRPAGFRWVAGAAVVLAIVQPLAPTLHHLWETLT